MKKDNETNENNSGSAGFQRALLSVTYPETKARWKPADPELFSFVSLSFLNL